MTALFFMVLLAFAGVFYMAYLTYKKGLATNEAALDIANTVVEATEFIGEGIRSTAQAAQEYIDLFDNIQTDDKLELKIQNTLKEEDPSRFFRRGAKLVNINSYTHLDFFKELEEALGGVALKKYIHSSSSTWSNETTDIGMADLDYYTFTADGIDFCVRVHYMTVVGKTEDETTKAFHKGVLLAEETRIIRRLSLAFDMENCDGECSTRIVSLIAKAAKENHIKITYELRSLDGRAYCIQSDGKIMNLVANVFKGVRKDDHILNASYNDLDVKNGSTNYRIPVSEFVKHITGPGPVGNSVFLGPAGMGKTTLSQHIMAVFGGPTILLNAQDLELLGTPNGRMVLNQFLMDRADESVMILLDEAQAITKGDPRLVTLYDLMDGTANAICPALRVVVCMNMAEKDVDPVLVRPGRTDYVVNITPLTATKVRSLVSLLSDKFTFDIKNIEDKLKTQNGLTLAEIFQGSSQGVENLFDKKFGQYRSVIV